MNLGNSVQHISLIVICTKVVSIEICPFALQELPVLCETFFFPFSNYVQLEFHFYSLSCLKNSDFCCISLSFNNMLLNLVLLINKRQNSKLQNKVYMCLFGMLGITIQETDLTKLEACLRETKEVRVFKKERGILHKLFWRKCNWSWYRYSCTNLYVVGARLSRKCMYVHSY